jgi:hypothetical protein
MTKITTAVRADCYRSLEIRLDVALHSMASTAKFSVIAYSTYISTSIYFTVLCSTVFYFAISLITLMQFISCPILQGFVAIDQLIAKLDSLLDALLDSF